MEQKKIDRINELARKSKTAEGLTEQGSAQPGVVQIGKGQTVVVIQEGRRIYEKENGNLITYR